MAYPTIGIVEELLVDWFSAIARWQPCGESVHHGCTSCADSMVTSTLGIADWPHDLVHPIATKAITMTEIVREHTATTHDAQQLVLQILAANASSARDIFDTCVAQRLNLYLRTEIEQLIDSVRLPA